MTAVDPVLTELTLDLDRVNRLLALIGMFREFGASEPGSSVDEASWPEATEMFQSAPSVRTDLPILSGSILLYAIGRFEYFVKQVIETVALETGAKVAAFSDLPEEFRVALKQNTLTIATNPRKFGYEEVHATILLQQYVNACNVQVGGITLAGEVLALTETNMRADVMAGLLKKVGVQNYWQEVGKQSSVKAFFANKDEKLCANDARARLNALIDARNQIAHPTSAGAFLDHESALREVRFLQLLATVTCGIAEVHLTSL